VPNVGGKIIKTLKVLFESNEVLSISNYDEVMSYFDLWLSKKDKSRQTEKGLALRVGSKDATGDVEETAIGKTLGNRFRIPIDFELLNSVEPYHQHSLADKLEIQLTFNDDKWIILGSTAALAAANDADYGYTFTDIRTEWDQITDSADSDIARSMAIYQMFALPFTRIVQHQFRVIKKSKPVINLNVNAPSKSLTHVLVLAIDTAKDRKPFEHETTYRNLDITKVNVTVEGKPNQLYAQGLSKENAWSEIVKLFQENGESMGEFLTEKYALLLDLRPSIDKKMHGNGVELRNTTDGLTIEIHRVPGSGRAQGAAAAESLNLHVFLLQDAQLNRDSGRFHSIAF